MLREVPSHRLKKKAADRIAPTGTVVHAMIECPAGTSIKRTYDEKAKKMVPHKNADGTVKRHAHLPYPANYGFVPGTVVKTAKGGDGGPLDILVLCETVPMGAVLDVDVIGILRISDEDVPTDDILLAVPRDNDLRCMDVKHVKDLPDGVLSMLKTWVVKHNTEKRVWIRSVKGPKAGMKAIRRWRVKG